MSSYQPDNGKAETIVPKWVGIKKNGKKALCTEIGDKVTWYNFGKDFVEPLAKFKVGETYSVLVGTDKFGNHYINGLTGVVGQSPEVAPPSPKEYEDFKKNLEAVKTAFPGEVVTTDPPNIVQINPPDASKSLIIGDMREYLLAIQSIVNNALKSIEGGR